MNIQKTNRRLCMCTFAAALFLGGVNAQACTINGVPGSINANIAPGATLTITGKCVENVVIKVDDVTLQGGTPKPSLLATNTDSTAILIDGARRVTIDNVRILRGQYLVRAENGATVTVSRSLLLRAREIGIYVTQGSTGIIKQFTKVMNGDPLGIPNSQGAVESHGIVASRSSNIVLDQVTVKNNMGWGVVVAKSSHGEISDTTVEDNTGDGVFAARSGNIEMNNTTVQNNGWGVGSYYNSQVQINDSTITNNGGNGADIFQGSTVDIRATSITADVGVRSDAVDGIDVTHDSSARLQDTTVTVDAGTVGAQTGFHTGIWVSDNSNLDMREGNTITTNVQDYFTGATLAVYRGSSARIRGGTDPNEAGGIEFNRIINTAPRTITSNSGQGGGFAIDAEHHVHVRIDRGHTKIEGNSDVWQFAVIDMRDVNHKGSLYSDDCHYGRISVRDQGTVPGNVTLEQGTAYFYCSNGNFHVRSGGQQPTFDADIDCGGTFAPNSPNFINAHGFVNCL